MSKELIGILGVLVGVVLGFLLHELSSLIRTKRKEKQQQQSVHTLIRIEIDQNLEKLRDFWGKVDPVDKNVMHSDENFHHRLIETGLPQWSHKIWENQMSLSPMALNENELKKVHYCHEQLKKITALHSHLVTLLVFKKRVEEIFQLKEIIEDVINAGNPLKSQ